MIKRPLVDVIMVTYNQEKYIAQAIQSVLNQKCDFTVRLIIGEDFSTDNTRIICQKYADSFPNKIKLLTNAKNLGLIRNYKSVIDNCSAKYLAILEGDDYWIDEYKLKKQVKILEEDKAIGLVHTSLNVLYENGDLKVTDITREKRYIEGYMYHSMMTSGKGGPSSITTCFRFDLMKEHFDFDYFIENEYKTLDAPLWLELAYHTKFKFIPDVTATYRILNNSVSNNKDINKLKSFNETSQCTLKYFLHKYPIKGLSEKKLLTESNYYMTELYLKNKMFSEAKITSHLMSLTKFKYIFIWLVANYEIFAPMIPLKMNFIKQASKLKQILFQLKKKLIP